MERNVARTNNIGNRWVEEILVKIFGRDIAPHYIKKEKGAPYRLVGNS